MDEFLGPVEPWIGLLDAFGVVAVALAWLALRDATDWVRTAVAGLAAFFLVREVLSFAGAIASFAGFVTVFPVSSSGGRLVLDVLLLAAGAAVGVAAVLTAHRRAAEAAEDLAAEAADDLADDDAGDEPDDDPYVTMRQRWVAAAPWIDLGAITLALALPVLTGYWFYGSVDLPQHGDVPASAAVFHILNGITAALPLLVVARRAAGRPLLLAALGLVALRLLVLPVAPEVFTNEFWSAFAIGLATGLLVTAVWRLLADVGLADRSAVATGAVAGVLLLTLTAAVSAKVLDDVGNRLVGEVPGDTFPTDSPFPTDFPFPPGFPFAPD